MNTMKSSPGNRKPVFAGQFYPAGKEELRNQIEECFLSGFGPGKMPVNEKKKQVLGVISPHAGYQFSGAAAAFSYREIAESSKADAYVMLGLSHSGLQSCVSLQDWETPLGVSKNDAKFGKMLGKLGIPVNEEAHSTEHSIEVQLPFLQFVYPDAKIVPVIASHDMDFKKIASAIKKTAEKLKRKIIIIASSDFTHYGPAYGYVPFSEDAKKNMYELDKGAIDAIKSLDSGKFISYLQKTGATICGQMPIAVLMEAIKAKKARLLKYYTSGDVMGDYANAVGYASIVFE